MHEHVSGNFEDSKLITMMRFSFKILMFLFIGVSNNPLNAQNNYKEVDFQELDRLIRKNFSSDFEFSIRIEDQDGVLFSGNYGYIDKKNSVLVNDKTLFNIASITKSITAVGIMKLVEQKEIQLSDRLNLFFDNVPKSKDSISISSLLSHKSGLRQTYPLDGISESNRALKVILNEKLEFSPGNGFRYSNQNYQLLALIIEQVTQTKFEEYIRKNVLLPLKMKDTFFWDEVNAQNNIAPINKRILRIIGNRNWGFIGSGGIFSTTSNLSMFWKGVYKNEFLTQESIDKIFTSYYETKSGIQIGFGFFITPKTKWETIEFWTRGTESWGHNSAIRFFPEKNLAIIVSTNSGEIGNDSAMTGNRLVSDLIANYLLE